MVKAIMNITDMEAIVLKSVAVHEMNPLNGGDPQSAVDVNTYCWAEDFTGGVLTVNQVKGVLSSLVKKSLVTINEFDDNDQTIKFTEAGFDVWFVLNS